MRFLADARCDFAGVDALREARYDKDFGLLAYAGGHDTAGVVLIRFPASARAVLGQAVVETVTKFGERLTTAFAVVVPGRARLSRPPSAAD